MKPSFSKIKFECTATMARLSNNVRPAGLKHLAKELLGEKIITYEDAKDSDHETFLTYAKNDADFTFRLFPLLKSELEEKHLWDLYEEIEKPFLLINLECQRNGIEFDREASKKEMLRLEQKVIELKGALNDPNMNWNSPKQLQRKIFGEFDLPLVYQKGKLSTGKRALRALAGDSRIATLLELKKCEALIRQIKTLEKFADPSTSRIHPFINPLGADTGRATSSCPNLQNIEKKSVLRNLFVASEGHVFVVLDYSQIEPRVLAHFLGANASFTQLFQSSVDFYEDLAERLELKLDGGLVARDVAKLVVLATLYGMGARTLAENLKISKETADSILTKFFNMYPEIIALSDQEVAAARKCGYVTGLMNRRRYIDHLNDTEKKLRYRAERQVLNSIIQGSAATLFKRGACMLKKELPQQVRFVHHIHDEFILEVPKDMGDQIYQKAKTILEKSISWFSIPLKVEGGIGTSWAEAKTSNKMKGGD